MRFIIIIIKFHFEPEKRRIEKHREWLFNEWGTVNKKLLFINLISLMNDVGNKRDRMEIETEIGRVW